MEQLAIKNSTPGLSNQIPLKMNPRVIGGYEIGEVLGVGKHGEVKRALHIESKQNVAIKFIPSEECDEGRCGWSEITSLKKLNHPNIVRLLDVLQYEDQHLLVLECLTGGELFDYLISRQRLKEKEAVRFVRQILSALEHCHKSGICHRDLKLENLLLDKDQNIKITDFGFSNCKNTGELMTTFVGSPSYAAPEIILNENYSGPPADIWSLGVIIYTILTGQMPFQDDNAAANYKKIENVEYEPPSDLSKEAIHLITNILVRNPEKRLTIEQLWAHPWMGGYTDSYSFGVYPSISHYDLLVERVLTKMTELGYSQEELKQLVAKREVSAKTATFYLFFDLVQAQKKEEDQNAEIAAAKEKLMGMMGGRRVSLGKGLSSPRRSRASPTLAEPTEEFRERASTAGARMERLPSVKECIDEKRDAPPSRKSSKLSVFQNSSKDLFGQKSRPCESPLTPTTPTITFSDAGETDTDTIVAAPKGNDTTSSSSNTSSSNDEIRDRANTWATDPLPSSVQMRSKHRASTPNAPVMASHRPRSCAVDKASLQASFKSFLRSLSENTVEDLEPGDNLARSLESVKFMKEKSNHSDTESVNSGEQGFGVLSSIPVIPQLNKRGGVRSSIAVDFRQNSEKTVSRNIDQTLDLASSQALGSFGAATTSSLPVAAILTQLKNALEKLDIEFSHSGPHKLICETRQAEAKGNRRRSSLTSNGVLCWELEICALPSLGMHGIRQHRISGDSWKYKEVLSSIMSSLKL